MRHMWLGDAASITSLRILFVAQKKVLATY
jgi:hypothetical protein